MRKITEKNRTIHKTKKYKLYVRMIRNKKKSAVAFSWTTGCRKKMPPNRVSIYRFMKLKCGKRLTAAELAWYSTSLNLGSRYGL